MLDEQAEEEKPVYGLHQKLMCNRENELKFRE